MSVFKKALYVTAFTLLLSPQAFAKKPTDQHFDNDGHNGNGKPNKHQVVEPVCENKWVQLNAEYYDTAYVLQDCNGIRVSKEFTKSSVEPMTMDDVNVHNIRSFSSDAPNQVRHTYVSVGEFSHVGDTGDVYDTARRVTYNVNASGSISSRTELLNEPNAAGSRHSTKVISIWQAYGGRAWEIYSYSEIDGSNLDCWFTDSPETDWFCDIDNQHYLLDESFLTDVLDKIDLANPELDHAVIAVNLVRAHLGL